MFLRYTNQIIEEVVLQRTRVDLANRLLVHSGGVVPREIVLPNTKVDHMCSKLPKFVCLTSECTQPKEFFKLAYTAKGA